MVLVILVNFMYTLQSGMSVFSGQCYLDEEQEADFIYINDIKTR